MKPAFFPPHHKSWTPSHPATLDTVNGLGAPRTTRSSYPPGRMSFENLPQALRRRSSRSILHLCVQHIMAVERGLEVLPGRRTPYGIHAQLNKRPAPHLGKKFWNSLPPQRQLRIGYLPTEHSPEQWPRSRIPPFRSSRTNQSHRNARLPTSLQLVVRLPGDG